MGKFIIIDEDYLLKRLKKAKNSVRFAHNGNYYEGIVNALTDIIDHCEIVENIEDINNGVNTVTPTSKID